MGIRSGDSVYRAQAKVCDSRGFGDLGARRAEPYQLPERWDEDAGGHGDDQVNSMAGRYDETIVMMKDTSLMVTPQVAKAGAKAEAKAAPDMQVSCRVR